MAAPPWDAGLQHRGRHQQLAQVHGPLVPHVCQDLHLHQQVEGLIAHNSNTSHFYFSSAINPILYNALSTKFRRSFRRTLHCATSSHDTPLGFRSPSVTYLTTTRHSIFSTSSRIELGDYRSRHSSMDYRRHSSKPYVERNGLLAVESRIVGDVMVNDTRVWKYTVIITVYVKLISVWKINVFPVTMNLILVHNVNWYLKMLNRSFQSKLLVIIVWQSLTKILFV